MSWPSALPVGEPGTTDATEWPRREGSIYGASLGNLNCCRRYRAQPANCRRPLPRGKTATNTGRTTASARRVNSVRACFSSPMARLFGYTTARPIPGWSRTNAGWCHSSSASDSPPPPPPHFRSGTRLEFRGYLTIPRRLRVCRKSGRLPLRKFPHALNGRSRPRS